jgi:hypothetical protein
MSIYVGLTAFTGPVGVSFAISTGGLAADSFCR